MIYLDKEILKNKTEVIEESVLFLHLINNEILVKNNSFKNQILNIKNKTNNLITHNIEECKYILYPYKYLDKQELIDEYIDLSIKCDKKILFFYIDDDSTDFIINDNIFFKTSIFTNSPNISMPTFCNDFIEYNIKHREKTNKPIIGFCGLPNNNIDRINVLNKINSINSIDKNIKLYQSFWGGSIWDINVRSEYVRNMSESDFILCVRGSGNFSIRLFETLSSGRIPIIINTDQKFPFKDVINYNDFSIFIDIREIDKIEEKILNFWQNTNEVEYIEKQKYCRYIWENYFSPYGFNNNINKLIEL